MTEYAFINDLCESHLIPSRTSLKHWKISKLTDLCYLYFLGLRILLDDKTTQDWARKYCDDAGEQTDFSLWRNNANDLYAMLFALTSEDTNLSPGIIRHWLRHMATHTDEDATHRLFMRLDSMFKVSSGTMRSMRRIVMEWDDADTRERHDVLIKLIQMIHTLAPSNSELLPELKKLSHQMSESASAGATGAASVASVVGGLGAGFDPDGDHGVYEKKKKPAILRR